MPHVGASRAGETFAVGPLIVANELEILEEQFVLWYGLFLFGSHLALSVRSFASSRPAWPTESSMTESMMVSSSVPNATGAGSQAPKVAEVMQTEASSGVDFAAEVCPTSCS